MRPCSRGSPAAAPGQATLVVENRDPEQVLGLSGNVEAHESVIGFKAVQSRVVALPFDPPLSFPMDLASGWPPDERAGALVDAALAARDTHGWLTRRRPRTELPED